MKNIAYLNVLSWTGILLGAVHFYGKLYIDGEQPVEIKHPLTKREAAYENKKMREMGSPGHYPFRPGKISGSFFDREELYASAIKLNRGRADFIIVGSSACRSVGECILAPSDELKDKINALWREALALDYYSGADDERMNEIDEEFVAIVKGARQ